MRPAKLRFAFPLPQPPPEQTQPLPQGGLAFPSESREDSFTPSPAANTCSRNKPSKQTATAPPLNLCRSQAPLGNASREALLRIPAPATCPRNKHSPRRKAGLPFHRNPGRILSHALLWSRPARRILKNPRRRISGGGLAGEKGCQIAIQHPGIPGRSSGPTIKATRNLSPPPPSPRNPPRRKTDSAPSG